MLKFNPQYAHQLFPIVPYTLLSRCCSRHVGGIPQGYLKAKLSEGPRVCDGHIKYL